jgi:uncharacterized protein (DUF1330 family)
MTTYAVGHLRTVDFNGEIVRYLQEIDATLAPFGGAFVVHGATPEVLEGPFPGDLVVIRFPDREAARAWYASDAYQAILPLRTANADSSVILVDDCGADHRATDILGEAA